MKIGTAMLGLIAMLGIMCLPAQAALQPLEEGYWVLPGQLTADKEASLRDLLKKQPADSIFQALAVPVAPATWGGDEAGQVAVANRLQAAYPGKLILITPTVGTEGWEASNNVPSVGAAGPGAPQTQAQWLHGLEACKGDKVGLVISSADLGATPRVQGETPPLDMTVVKAIGGYVKTFAQWCHAHGKTCLIWLPAEALTLPGGTAALQLPAEPLTGPGNKAALRMVAKAGGKLVDRWVWTDAAGMSNTNLPGLLKQICAITPGDNVVLEYSPGAPGTDTPAHAEAFMAAAQAAGIDRFAVAGTPEQMTGEGWGDFFKGLSLVMTPPPCGSAPAPGGG